MFTNNLVSCRRKCLRLQTWKSCPIRSDSFFFNRTKSLFSWTIATLVLSDRECGEQGVWLASAYHIALLCSMQIMLARRNTVRSSKSMNSTLSLLRTSISLASNWIEFSRLKNYCHKFYFHVTIISAKKWK